MLRTYSLIGLITVMAFCCIRIVSLEGRKAQLNRDRIEINHIKYGLFNVDEWKALLADILTKKIRQLEVTKENRPKMKKELEKLLYKMVDELDRGIQQNGTRSISGFVQTVMSNILGVKNRIREKVPEFADMALDHLNDPKVREDLKDYLIKQLNEMADSMVGKMDYTAFNAILYEYSAEDKATCLARIDGQLGQVRVAELSFIALLSLCCIGLATMIFVGQHYGSTELITMVVGASVLLLTGLSLPMIDIEATIASFSFTLVGEPVEFKDQVLFFQSKSILQVVGLLLKNGGVGLLLVALLVFSFSVLFPMAKLIASVVTIVQDREPTHWLHRFLVFKSGKWSMADVMVVAIFMSYIGFNGVINSQLTQLAAFSGNVEVFTTNNSVLQSGFYLFTGYCITGLLISAMIEKRLAKSQN
ncbi:MAG: paraquat-inducible protein A [Flavobacteriales bacterium]|nr:paraquat-inducible protein A [Flavobacteriales bacterium]